MIGDFLSRIWQWIVSGEEAVNASFAPFLDAARTIDGLDVDKGLARSNGRPERYCQALASIKVHLPVVIKRIECAPEASSVARLGMEMRSLGNLLLYIGADSLSTKAEELDELLRGGDIEGYKHALGEFSGMLRVFADRLAVLPNHGVGEQSCP